MFSGDLLIKFDRFSGNCPYFSVSFAFKGAIPPESATFGSIPQGYNSEAEGLMHTLPTRTQGLMVSWKGPRYSGDGIVMAEEGEHSVCMQYSTTESADGAPVGPTDCARKEMSSAKIRLGPREKII